ncbi:MAG: HupE/UreJ family protein, partial [Gammaproteobacteria bacterium]|nr:HupE/UreJ family protein [Gammaproteobacteria bacterium]NIR95363.1 HupE/UreJ family protein [Gammaproteobacteria bacterium]
SKQEDAYTAYLLPGKTSDRIPLQGVETQSVREVFANYLVIGFEHIIPKGLDHILFVVGLFLLSLRLAPLFWQITSFTIAHSITLALGILGYANISPAIVEPLIALSIVYVCVENIISDKLHKWRPVVIFSFGLLHGLGFASVLTDIGLSTGHFISGLIAFNIGIELGQLAVIAICYFSVAYWLGHKVWYRRVITIPASGLIAIIGAYWFIERAFL